MDDVRGKLLGIELIVGLGKREQGSDLSELAEGLDLNEGKRLVRRVVEMIHSGALGYALIAARKE